MLFNWQSTCLMMDLRMTRAEEHWVIWASLLAWLDL